MLLAAEEDDPIKAHGKISSIKRAIAKQSQTLVDEQVELKRTFRKHEESLKKAINERCKQPTTEKESPRPQGPTRDGATACKSPPDSPGIQGHPREGAIAR